MAILEINGKRFEVCVDGITFGGGNYEGMSAVIQASALLTGAEFVELLQAWQAPEDGRPIGQDIVNTVLRENKRFHDLQKRKREIRERN